MTEIAARAPVNGICSLSNKDDMSARRTKSKFARILIGIVSTVVILVVAVLLLIVRWKFYPAGATPVVGPSGSANRAFIENRSFGDLSFVLCASDWPHTFTEPISLESVLYSEGSNSRVFWSSDGSVVAVKDGSSFTSAYDYKLHDTLRYDSAKITMLIASRGGLGTEQRNYPDGKGDY